MSTSPPLSVPLACATSATSTIGRTGAADGGGRRMRHLLLPACSLAVADQAGR